MGSNYIQKHYLDTSIVRPMLLGTLVYRKYIASQFGNDPCYISQFIRMEFSRSYLLKIIGFYFTIRLPTMQTIDDAFSYWSNKYKSSELKAIIQLVADVIRQRVIDFNRPNDKPIALRQLGRYIKRIEYKLRREFNDIGKDSTRCARAAVPLKADPEDIAAGFRKFLEAFDDEETCRKLCRIDHFLFNRYISEIEGYIKKADELPTNNNTRGFKMIAENLKRLLDKGKKLCTCKMCGKIGDAVIALDAPRNMKLECIDRAFDYLCPPVNQPHKRHPSETSFFPKKI